jgi:glycolate oxidase iron-sulfur subunit
MKHSVYLEEISKCVRCGSCKALCPTYDEDSIESMGARGRIALLSGLSSGLLALSSALNDRIFSCILCGSCSGQCPLGINISEVIYHGRNLLKNKDKKRKYLRFLAMFYTKKPNLSFKLLVLSQHILFPYLRKKGILPFYPEIPIRQMKDRLQVYTVYKKKGRVAVFTGCTVNIFYPHLQESLINVLQRLGYEVILPSGEVCCGTPLRTLGLEEEAIELARKNLEIFRRLNVEAILSLCPTCTLTMKKEYRELIGESLDNVMDISSFFIDKINTFSHLSSEFKSAIYHNPCHLKYGLGIEREPKEIIRKIGIDLLEPQEERCCGFGGIFSLSYRKLSQGLLEKCISYYINASAETIVTSCPGCMIQISKEIKNKPVVHLIEVIEEALQQKP